MTALFVGLYFVVGILVILSIERRCSPSTFKPDASESLGAIVLWPVAVVCVFIAFAATAANERAS